MLPACVRSLTVSRHLLNHRVYRALYLGSRRGRCGCALGSTRAAGKRLARGWYLGGARRQCRLVAHCVTPVGTRCNRCPADSRRTVGTKSGSVARQHGSIFFTFRLGGIGRRRCRGVRGDRGCVLLHSDEAGRAMTANYAFERTVMRRHGAPRAPKKCAPAALYPTRRAAAQRSC